MPKPKKPVPPPAVTAPGGFVKPLAGAQPQSDGAVPLEPLQSEARPAHKPLPHADSPTLAADSAEFKADKAALGSEILDFIAAGPPPASESWVASTHTLSEAEAHGHTITEPEAAALKKNWRCKTDGQLNTGNRCTTCGTGRK